MELSRKVNTGEIKAGRYYFRRNIDTEVYGFPKEILDIHPSYIDIESDGNVRVEIGGMGWYFGITLRPSYGNRELIPGLWYYDSNYHKESNYDQKIDRLISKYNKR